MRRAIVSMFLIAGCGRIDFDEYGDLALVPLSARTNLNSYVSFSASGGLPPYVFSIDSGAGAIDPANGRYLAPGEPGSAAIRVTDQLGHSLVAQVTFGGNVLWFAGGRPINGIPVADVWRSDDGTTWTPAASLPQPISDAAMVVFDDRMWLIGGTHVQGTYAGDVYSSRDGVTWDFVGASLPPACWGEPHAAVHQGLMWVVRAGCVYASADGVTWIEQGSFPDLSHAGKVLSHGGALYYAGGHQTSSTAVYDTVYKSADGATWTKVGALPSPRYLHGMTVFGGRLWVVGGYDNVVDLADGAVSDDGAVWVPIAPLPATRDGLDTIVLGGRLLVIGGSDTPVYATTDGTAWTTIGALPAGRFGGQVFAFTPP